MNKTIEQRAKDLERIKKFIIWIESNRLFYVDEVRVWIKRMLNEEISFSKFVELFNEKVFDKYAHIAGATEANDECRAALQELVYLKSIKDIPDYREEYESRKQKAWAAAKKAVAKSSPPSNDKKQ